MVIVNPIKNEPVSRLKILMFFVALVLVGWFLWQGIGGVSGIDRGTYQAVFLTNNQVYFGKLKNAGGDFLTLKNAHSLQVASTDPGAIPPVSLNIVSLKNQAHAPVDTMYIPREQVLFWENLTADSQAIKVIKEQEAAQ